MALRKSGGRIYVAKQTFQLGIDGRTITVVKGETVREGHPLLKGRESLFELLVVRHEVDVVEPRIETATAAPGEKRY